MVPKSILLLDRFVLLLPAQSCHSDDVKIFHLSRDSTIHPFIDVLGAFFAIPFISDVLKAIFPFLSFTDRVGPTSRDDSIILTISSGSLRVQRLPARIQLIQ
jgi:hypothetical protein